MNKRLSRAIELGLMMAVAACAGCAGAKDRSGTSSEPSDVTGTIRLSLTLPGGTTLSTVSWTILSGTTLVASGTANAGNGPTVSFVVTALAAGSYTIHITSASIDGSVTCAGTGAFAIVARQTSQATVNLECETPRADAGSVVVNGTLNECATVQSIAATPTEVIAGGSVTLTATATAPNPGGITYQWSAPSGTFGSPNSATTTFTNATAGPVQVTLQVGDGPVASGFVCDSSLDTASQTLTFDPIDGGGSGGQAGSIYVVDSVPHLLAFDSTGAFVQSASLPTPIGDINGGGIAYAAGDLYVTIGQFTNSIAEFDLALNPQSPSSGAFAGLGVPRGIAFDSANSLLYVGNGAATVTVYGLGGSTMTPSGAFPGFYGPSGVAYDSDDGTIWVANYVGSPSNGTPIHGVAEYNPDGSARKTFDYGTQFVAPGAHEQPYSVAVCPASVTGGVAAVVVGFIDDGSGQGTGAVLSYSTSGAPIGSPFAGPITKPYGLSCDPQGNVYIADATGLYRASTSGANLGLPGSFSGITAPVYGVLALGPQSVRIVDDGGVADAGPNSDGGPVRLPLDAGPSGGERPDGSPLDAGPSDGGSPDGSPLDAGPSDGGSPDGSPIELFYTVPLTASGAPPTSGANDPFGQTLRYSVVTYDDATNFYVASANQVNIEPAKWEPTPTDEAFTIQPLASTDTWQPFFSATDGYIAIQFSPPVSVVNIDEEVIYSGPAAGSALLSPIPEPFLAAFSAFSVGTLTLPMGDASPISLSGWQTLSVGGPDNPTIGAITAILIGAPPGNTNETPNVMFKNLSYSYF
jgi:hypothetical protein